MPSRGVNRFEFLDALLIAKTRVLRLLRLSVGEDFVILACVVFNTDGQRDGRRGNPIVANTELCIASYADALYKGT